TDYFYTPVGYLYNRDIISGYADNTFRPYNTTTRAQISKIIVVARGWQIDTTSGPHFHDVPASDMFYNYIETAYNHNLISGYACGGAGEPCDSDNKPYFRPNSMVTRAQL